MAGAEKAHFSPRQHDIGALILKVPKLGKWATRAGTSADMHLKWSELPDVDPGSIDWAEEVPGDPEAGFLSRHWQTAAVLGISTRALAGLDAHDAEHRRYAQDAVAFEHDGVVTMGLNPESPHIFGGAPAWYNGDDIFTAAMRRGRGPLRATMGLYTPGEGLMVPEGAIVVQARIPNKEIPNKFPHTPLVL